ncbi:MAG: non-heme iron oxygenase ferredoxin subunit [Nitrososphaerota archaeon]
MALVRVCRLSEIPTDSRLVVDVGGRPVLLINNGERIYALSNICTHEYAELENGLVVGDTITCPVHLSRFKLDTGQVLNPPATKALPTYKVVLIDGEIFVEV